MLMLTWNEDADLERQTTFLSQIVPMWLLYIFLLQRVPMFDFLHFCLLQITGAFVLRPESRLGDMVISSVFDP